MSSQALMAKISLPYAEALVESGQASKTLDQMSEDVTMIKQILEESDIFKTFIDNPLIGQESKKEVIKQLFSGQVSDNLLTFLLVLVERKRIAYLGPILDKYLEIAYALDSLVIAKITSSVELTDIQESALIDKLKSMTGTQQVQLEILVDAQLIGGFIIQVGSKIIDTSLRGQLENIGYFLQVTKV